MGIRAFILRRRHQLFLALRIVIAAIAALVLAQWLNQPLPLWAALTAVLVTQVNVGRSLKTTIDYFIGTMGGAIYGGAVGIFVPHGNEYSLLGALALTVAPLAYVAAVRPTYSVAPITGILVLFIPQIAHISPLDSAIDRVIEVGVGGAVGLAVSLLLFPASAHSLFAGAAARVLDQIAQALDILFGSMPHGLDRTVNQRLQDDMGEAMTQLSVVGSEAEHELSARLSHGPEPGPLLRTLVRLRHDLVMIGRAAAEPLPPELYESLKTPLAQVQAALTGYLRGCRDALLKRGGAPSLTAVAPAFDAYAEAVAVLRRDGLTLNLSGEVAERFFALGFGLEQARRNLADLDRCIAEWAEGPAAARRKP